MLPALIAIDCKFSLAQPWIRSLISCWHEQEDEKKILHVFFGTPNRGRRTHKLLIENWRRDQKIIAAVAQLIGGGCSQNEATRRVAGKLGELGIRECLSARNIRRIYKEPDSLSPRTLDNLVARGDLPAFKVTRKVLFRKRDLELLAERHRIRALGDIAGEVIEDLRSSVQG